jgi:hypothetical protein
MEPLYFLADSGILYVKSTKAGISYREFYLCADWPEKIAKRQVTNSAQHGL